MDKPIEELVIKLEKNKYPLPIVYDIYNDGIEIDIDIEWFDLWMSATWDIAENSFYFVTEHRSIEKPSDIILTEYKLNVEEDIAVQLYNISIKYLDMFKCVSNSQIKTSQMLVKVFDEHDNIKYKFWSPEGFQLETYASIINPLSRILSKFNNNEFCTVVYDRNTNKLIEIYVGTYY